MGDVSGSRGGGGGGGGGAAGGGVHVTFTKPEAVFSLPKELPSKAEPPQGHLARAEAREGSILRANTSS